VTAREVARRVLERVERGGAWATPTLDGELVRAGLDERDRRLASELVYGVLRHRTRIDRAIAAHADLKRTPPRVLGVLRVAAYQLMFLDRVPSYAVVDDAVAAAREASGAKLGGFTNAVLRKLSTAREPAFPASGRERIEIEYSLPPWILDELTAAIGDEPRIAELAAAFAQQPPLVARGNRTRITRDALIEELRAAGVTSKPIEFALPPVIQKIGPPSATSSMALELEGLGDPARSASFNAGLWTVQDTGAQLVGHIAAPHVGKRILDACAGVGGKSTHLAELTDNTAHIDAADQSDTKLGLLEQTARRLGLLNIHPYVCDLLDPTAPLGDRYDLIVLDAPCTGLGVLRRHPDAKWRLKPADVARLAKLQAQLLDSVVRRLAPGGTLVYSVCTFTRAEGPEQIRALVERSKLELVAEHRTWPPEADAFYIARLQRH
jgi:16S rRNA (cytosine967-C5)-methyltransferase